MFVWRRNITVLKYVKILQEENFVFLKKTSVASQDKGSLF